MSRTILAEYTDPLDLVWTNAAKKMGLRVNRTRDAYASTDGRGTLSLSEAATMDPDDCLAQMILHEICHWMVQGSSSIGWVDWGLDNEGTIDTEREHACLRLQAALLDPYGLRATLGPTTDFRSYYDALPVDPFEQHDPREAESIVRARAAYARRNQRPFRQHLETALSATATILETTRRVTDDKGHPRPIAHLKTDSLGLHRTGLPQFPTPVGQCGDCAWYYETGKSRQGKCRQSAGRRTEASEPSCSHYEHTFDCLGCGACCREAYDTVEIGPRDPARKLHLDLLVERTGGYDMSRNGSRCSCLRGGIVLTPPKPSISGGNSPDDAGRDVPPLTMPGGAPFTCSIYETRPKTCRDFTIFSEHCLYARRRVGLSR